MTDHLALWVAFSLDTVVGLLAPCLFQHTTQLQGVLEILVLAILTVLHVVQSLVLHTQYMLANKIYSRNSLVLRHSQHEIGHCGDVLPSQSLGLVLKNEKNITKANMHP